MAATAIAAVGCGEEGESAGVDTGIARGSAVSEYEEVLGDFQTAASESESYDAYGFAEYFPATQRAAVHAFCFIADRLFEDPAGEELEDPPLTRMITRKAEADLKSERDIVAPRPARRAIGKLRAILGLESLDRDQAEDYVRACYR
ncbi:MAG TPA: hypothetical protein VFM94_02075 [Solirubrobacterales bacterium]|nr:hypothetical protein [Solirubrobacterales bacterium]